MIAEGWEAVMQIKSRMTIESNQGGAVVVEKGQRIRIEGTSIVDFVCFNRDDQADRLDQARTKAVHSKLFLTTGDFLISRADRRMFKIVHDGFPEGTHDLDKGMCSASAFGYRLKSLGKLDQQEERAIQTVPTHGCWENLTEALKPWNIAPEDIPNPFNIFMTMAVDGKTGALEMTRIRPKQLTHVDLVAEMDCLVGISACPDLMAGGKSTDVTVYDE
jgi:uncharacterized protein YcgI (DUF1989 family)